MSSSDAGAGDMSRSIHQVEMKCAGCGRRDNPRRVWQ